MYDTKHNEKFDQYGTIVLLSSFFPLHTSKPSFHSTETEIIHSTGHLCSVYSQTLSIRLRRALALLTGVFTRSTRVATNNSAPSSTVQSPFVSNVCIFHEKRWARKKCQLSNMTSSRSCATFDRAPFRYRHWFPDAANPNPFCLEAEARASKPPARATSVFFLF